GRARTRGPSWTPLFARVPWSTMSSPRPVRSLGASTLAPTSLDPKARFEAMVHEHYARLGAFVYRLVGSRPAAEDVVHEVLLGHPPRGGRDAARPLVRHRRGPGRSGRRHAARDGVVQRRARGRSARRGRPVLGSPVGAPQWRLRAVTEIEAASYQESRVNSRLGPVSELTGTTPLQRH